MADEQGRSKMQELSDEFDRWAGRATSNADDPDWFLACATLANVYATRMAAELLETGIVLDGVGR